MNKIKYHEGTIGKINLTMKFFKINTIIYLISMFFISPSYSKDINIDNPNPNSCVSRQFFFNEHSQHKITICESLTYVSESGLSLKTYNLESIVLETYLNREVPIASAQINNFISSEIKGCSSGKN